ncbi:hypothetical protein EW026_g5690 [Hermanssonia centrifuga]|uniref:UBX domain-containing protein n=1 Tax=Hermanssonia centrifuga TaxID=98765 RepID=A0A4S4KDC4_9APHY|nr:hypothetical protein EW026_g5690 [Hermanssonia centrifuga]
MDHIIENEGTPVPDPSAVSGTQISQPTGGAAGEDMDDEDVAALKAVYGHKGGADAQAAAAAADVEAKSIKCSECGKIFRNTSLAQFHAEKSGHDQFEESTEEIKPLTEEEKKQKLAELRDKMAAKRAVKAKEEAKEHKANEAIRRKSGKCDPKDINEIREELKQKEIIKEAEAKRREKVEDAKARAAIKAQIEADKKARAEKAAKEKALREGKAFPETSAPATSASAPSGSIASGIAGRDYPQTRLQIRMASGGQPYTTTLASDATLREVAEFLAGQSLSVDVDTVTFVQHFPRKQFNQSDFSRTLRDLGLTPSAVLIAS